MGLHCPRQRTLNHKQVVHTRLAEAMAKFGNQEVNQLKIVVTMLLAILFHYFSNIFYNIVKYVCVCWADQVFAGGPRFFPGWTVAHSAPVTAPCFSFG